jgi:hypothetical protein
VLVRGWEGDLVWDFQLSRDGGNFGNGGYIWLKGGRVDPDLRVVVREVAELA